MLVKSADDKSRRIRLLEELQSSPALDAQQKRWARDELARTRRGIEGERDAAHYIDAHYRDSVNFAVIHDLRLEVDGEVAQIDHLLVGRALRFYLLETKNFGGNVRINEHGEFSVQYPGEREYGIPSPFEQSRRHERILAKLLERLGIVGRVGTSPSFTHAVLVHPRATITRPPADAVEARAVVKADQFHVWHDRHVDKDVGFAQSLAVLVNLHGSEKAREWAEALVAQHRPLSPLLLPDFMKPQVPQKERLAPKADAGVEASANARKLVCAACGCKISFAEGKFCWNNPGRFGGAQYCRLHQAEHAKTPA